jgi:uncharacterized Zn finger protein
MNDIAFECPNCGTQTEVDTRTLSEPLTTKCAACESFWSVEIIPGDYWLEPLQQLI